uniref:Uncharacterized protein n=1 Tax=Trichuris muris TaxID=70415 RepID=A0A5S6Q3B6_TRIMR
MASSSGLPILKDRLLQYIWNNPKVSLDLATMWAYRAYTDEKGLTVGPALENPALGNERPRKGSYDDCLKRLSAFSRPDYESSEARRQLFSVLISFATLNNATLSTRTLGLVKEFYVTQYTRGIVRSALLEFLHYLKLPSPPDFLVPETNEQPMAKWEESSIDLCLRLFCHLLKLDGNDIEADTLSTLIDTCPDDAETLVTRIIRQCAARSELSPTVVQKIWNLYESRKPDVRFLCQCTSTFRSSNWKAFCLR